jgi:hypothetical protein
MTAMPDSWYEQRARRLLEHMNRLDEFISTNKADGSQKATKADVAALQTWVKLAISNIRDIYGIEVALDRDAHYNARFHAVLTDRIDKLGKDTKAQLSTLNTTIDKRDKEITDTLKLILKWKRQSQRTINRAKEYFNGLVRR